MSETYRVQREAMLGRLPGIERLLPETPPEPLPVAALPPVELRRLLAEAANNHASLAVVVGWGDGTVPLALLGDPLARQKDLLVLLLPGEASCFAAAFRSPILELVQCSRLRLAVIARPEEVEATVIAQFGRHEDIPQLAGADFLDRHPLCAEAERSRAEILPRLNTLLADRPQAYGNDVIDSFTGILHAARNARILLPAPTIGEDMRGFFGTTPVISIAAGPSVKRHLARLRELQDRCILVACDAVLHGLLDAGIQPHFVTPLERVDLIKPMLARAGECSTIYAGLPVCPPEVVQQFGPERAIGIYCADRLYPWLLAEPHHPVNSGLSTGVLSVTVAAALGRGPVFLVGHDLARDASGSHWDGAKYAGDDWKRGKSLQEASQTVLSGYEERWIPGNDGKTVPSIAWWDRFRGDIAYEAGNLKAEGRSLFNVNAHDRVGARIDHTEPAPLPDPASLPRLDAWKLPGRDEGRLRRWQERARHLAADAEALDRALVRLRDDIAATRKQPPDRWEVEALAARLDLSAGVSEGNRMAFSYMLRSALHNCNAEMHWKRRTASHARSRWAMLDSMDALCQAIGNVLTTLKPQFEEIVRDHAS